MARGYEYDYGERKYKNAKAFGGKEIATILCIVAILGGALAFKDAGIVNFGSDRNGYMHVVDIPASKGYGAQVVAIADSICDNENLELSTVEKYKALHDFVVYVLDYDSEALQPGHDIRYGYGANDPATALINGIGVCGAYADLYRDLCEAAGLECYTVEGKAYIPGVNTQIGHAWNAINIDGEWYHVDCCWADTGGKRYEYFARGDNYIQVGDGGNFREAYQSAIPFSSKDYSFKRNQMPDNFTINWK